MQKTKLRGSRLIYVTNLGTICTGEERTRWMSGLTVAPAGHKLRTAKAHNLPLMSIWRAQINIKDGFSPAFSLTLSTKIPALPEYLTELRSANSSLTVLLWTSKVVR